MIAPNDPKLVYSPGNWDVSGTVAKTINAGASVRGLIAGNPASIAATFDVSGLTAPLPQVTAWIDDVPQTFTIAASVPLTIPAGRTATKHSVELVFKSHTAGGVQRWNPQNTALMWTGFNTTGTLETYHPKNLKGMVFGTSITEGVRTLNMTATLDTDRNDATVGWAYLLNKELSADVGVVGFGSSSMLNSNGEGIPKLAVSMPLLWGGGPARSFAGLDFVWIEQGTNDTTSNTTAEFTSVFNFLIGATDPDTLIFAARPYVEPHGTNQAPFIQAAIAACSNPSRIQYVNTAGWQQSQDSAGDGLHPNGAANVANFAPRVANTIRTALLARGGTTVDPNQFINVNGTFVPLTTG